jgi:hypothetical protein
MQVILQGSLQHFPSAELLEFLCRPGRKGTLDAEAPGRRTRILFHDQNIVGAQSKTAGEGMDAVLDVLEWKEGTFTLLDAAILPDGVAALALTLPALHAEAKRRAEERVAGFPDATFFHVVEDPALQQQVSLKAEEFKLLFRLAAGRTFAELLAEYAIPRRELADRLKYLRSLGLITSESDPEKTEPREVQEKTAEKERPQDVATIAESVPVPFVDQQQEAERTMMQAPASMAPRAAEAPVAAAPSPPRPPVAEAPPPLAPPVAAAPAPAAVPVEEPVAAPAMQTSSRVRRPTLVGSLTPDEAPDNVFPLLDAECVIGRRPAAGVSFAIDDGSISSQHARLTRSPEGFAIEDLGSKNGTFVNGEKVTAKRMLADGDLIRLGKVIMTFNVATENKLGSQTMMELRVD